MNRNGNTTQQLIEPSEGNRIETDSFGPIEVSEAHLWGAQTQRSLQHFAISTEQMPREFIRALALVKRACAGVNAELGHDLFAQQLVQIAVRLKEAGAAAALHLLFHRDDEAVQQRREQHNGQNLAHLLQDDVTAHGSSLS